MVRKGEAGKYPFGKISDIALADFKLGVVRDYNYGEEFKAALLKPDFKESATEELQDLRAQNKPEGQKVLQSAYQTQHQWFW